MKNKTAIIVSGFMEEYISKFVELCEQHCIETDYFYSDPCTSTSCNKKISDIKRVNKTLSERINPENYDYVLSDCQPISFGCNVFHGVTTACRMERSPFLLYKAVFFLTHLKSFFMKGTFIRIVRKPSLYPQN